MKCGKCGAKEIEFNFTKGKISCKFCGYLIEENISNPEINFETKKFGKKEIKGKIIHKQNDFKMENRARQTLFKFGVRRKMTQLGSQLRISNELIESAFQLFMFSVQNKLKVSKNLHSLSISCLYAICRKEKTPHLLIDFSDISQTRSSKIGVEFLKFLKVTRFPLPVIDPSVYIHRFVSKLNLENKASVITITALRLIARMKRNWMSTGRKPTGLCGAAIMLSTRIHGVEINQKEICKIVRIGNQALRSRLIEVEKTSIKKLDIYKLDSGGGDDGNKESLLDINFDEEKNIVFKQKKKENLVLDKTKFVIDRPYDCNLNFLKTCTKSGLPFKKNSINIIKKKKNETSSQTVINYINSEFETLIKEQIWDKMNGDFTNFQAIRSRVQKEKPYAFFENKKSSFVKNLIISEIKTNR